MFVYNFKDIISLYGVAKNIVEIIRIALVIRLILFSC